jgi:hypothetical protein
MLDSSRQRRKPLLALQGPKQVPSRKPSTAAQRGVQAPSRSEGYVRRIVDCRLCSRSGDQPRRHKQVLVPLESGLHVLVADGRSKSAAAWLRPDGRAVE